MTEQETLYFTIGQKIKDAEQSQMFGKPCFKINRKAFICFFQNEMVFKLTGKKRPMKEWVQIPFSHSHE